MGYLKWAKHADLSQLRSPGHASIYTENGVTSHVHVDRVCSDRWDELCGAGGEGSGFLWLEKAYAEKSDDLEWIKVNRSADALRSDPRYADQL